MGVGKISTGADVAVGSGAVVGVMAPVEKVMSVLDICNVCQRRNPAIASALR
jgi:hypothetical protein